MSRVMVVSAVALWAGSALLLSEMRWLSRPSLAQRLAPYGPGGRARRAASAPFSIAVISEVLGPPARLLGDRVARLFGVAEEVAVRLARTHASIDVTAFRLRQLGWSLGAFGLVAIVLAAVRAPGILGLFAVPAAALLGFLVTEQRLAAASAQWQHRVFLELPVVAEQLAMLLSAGLSLGAALNRLAARSRGTCSRDLARVTDRMRQGLSEAEALREWAALEGVEALDRLVSVLALNSEATDLGRLVSNEARATRLEVQRQLVAEMEKRGQKVWVPVTVATLVPGAIVLAIPFAQALRLFAGG